MNGYEEVVVETDLDNGGFGVHGNDQECYHCSDNPEKFLALPKEKQPYCSKCFDSMFVGLSVTTTTPPAPYTHSPNHNQNHSDNFNSADPDHDNNNRSPSPPPPPPVFSTRPPPVPPKPYKGVPPILFSTLPQPFHSRSGSGSSGGSYSSTTGPVVAPSVPYTFTTPPTPPPPSPPPPLPSTNDPSLSSSSPSRAGEQRGKSPDSFPPPPPFETDLDNVDDDMLTRYSNANTNVGAGANATLKSDGERRGYTSPLPSRIYINPTTTRSPSPSLSPKPYDLRSNSPTAATTTITPPSSSPSFLPAKTIQSPTRPLSPNPNRANATGTGTGTGTGTSTGKLYNTFNSPSPKSTVKKFDYKTFASIPKTNDDEYLAFTKPKPTQQLQSLEAKPADGVSRSSGSSSDSDSDHRKKNNEQGNSTLASSASYTLPQNQSQSPRLAHKSPINPISTIGSWVEKQQQQLQQQQHPKPQPQQQPPKQAPVFVDPVPIPVPAQQQKLPAASDDSSGSRLKKSVSVEPEETHLDQLNSIFKMGNLKDKQRGDGSYTGGESLGLTRVKPPITAAKPNFTCSKCKVNLLGKTVESKSGKHFCTPCYRNELANQPGCFKCGGSFSSETSLVTYKGEDWHADCFKCEKCQLPIGSKTFCNQKDGIFCADCYFESSGRKCVKCKKYLKSTGFLFRNEPWHHECFVCTTCSKPLGDNQILCKDDQPYCSTCYDDNYLEKCFKCHKILVGETIEYETHQFHDHCFCCESCEKPIGSTSFYPREGKVFCEPCFTQKFAKKCHKCAQVISPSNGFGLVYKQTHYHRNCFICTHCSKSLANIAVHSTKTSDDPFCGDCYDHLYSKRCTSCTNIISGVIGSKFMSFEGRYWHVECFNCKLCQTSLENRKFFPSQGEMLCIACSRYSPYNASQ